MCIIWCMPSDLITTVEAAHLRGVHRTTITRWVQRGRLTPSQTVGIGTRAVYLFHPADVLAA